MAKYLLRYESDKKEINQLLWGCLLFVPGNQCLGTGTKWCCGHTMSTRYVTVYIFKSDAILDLNLSSENKAVNCLKSRKTVCSKVTGAHFFAWVQGLNLNLGTDTVPEF